MRAAFTLGRHQVFAYLLFILLYVPCLAAMGTAYRELGRLYSAIMAVYLTVLGWSVATLYFQLSIGHSPVWTTVPIVLLLAMFGSFAVMGKKRKIDFLK
jgi:ferrous iron transport protein B